MPVLKATRSPTMLREAVVLDLGDVAGQAVRLREAARRQAEHILEEAREEAAKLTEKGEEEGFAKGHAAGLERGEAEGRERGHAEGMHEAIGAMEELRESLAEVMQNIEAAHREAVEEAEASVVELALRIAERVIGRAVEADPSLVVDSAREAVATVMGQREVTLRVHPEDLPLLEAAMPDLLARVADLEHVHLESDDGIQRGGCIATFGQGETDATLNTKLDRIAVMLVGHSVQRQDAKAPRRQEEEEG